MRGDEEGHTRRKKKPGYDFPRTLGIGLRKGPWGLCFLVSEVPLYLGTVAFWHFRKALQRLRRDGGHPLRRAITRAQLLRNGLEHVTLTWRQLNTTSSSHRRAFDARGRRGATEGPKVHCEWQADFGWVVLHRNRIRCIITRGVCAMLQLYRG